MLRPVSRIPGHRIAQRVYRRFPLGRPMFALVKPFLGTGKLFAIPFGDGELLTPTEWVGIEMVHGLLGGQPFLNPEFAPMCEAERLLEGRPGVFVDVGSAIGAYVLWLRRRFANRIISFEPSPVAAAVLAEMLEVNQLRDVEVRQVALGAQAGGFFALKIGANSQVEEGASVSSIDDDSNTRDWLSSDIFKAIEKHTLVKHVPISTLDQELQACEHVAFIKIDVEGLEFQVLDGAREILKRHRPLIWMEGHPTQIGHFGHRLEEVFDLLRSYGYQIRIWDNGELNDSSRLRRLIQRIGGPSCKETTWDIVSKSGTVGMPAQIFVLAVPPSA